MLPNSHLCSGAVENGLFLLLLNNQEEKIILACHNFFAILCDTMQCYANNAKPLSEQIQIMCNSNGYCTVIHFENNRVVLCSLTLLPFLLITERSLKYFFS